MWNEDDGEEKKDPTKAVTPTGPPEPGMSAGSNQSSSNNGGVTSRPAEFGNIGNPLYCACVDGKYIYKDPTTQNEFLWDEDSKQWKPKNVAGSSVQYDGNSYTYTDAIDGTVFEWDATKSAWFPKAGGADSRTAASGNTLRSNSVSHETTGFNNPNYDITLQSSQPRRFYYAALSPTSMGVDEPVLFLSPDDQVNNNSTIPAETEWESSDQRASTATKSSSVLPPGWEKHDDSNGPYYWHIKSGTIQREVPTSEQILGPTSNPALLIPGTLTSKNLGSFRKSQTISSQLSSSVAFSSSDIPNGTNSTSSVQSSFYGTSHVGRDSNVDNREKRKSWSQYLENSENEQSRMRESLLLDKSRSKSESSLRFVAVSLGCLCISEEDLTPERSSRAVSKVIAELTNLGLGGKGITSTGLEVAGKIWGGGCELYLELDDSHLRVKTRETSLVVAEQPIHSIRVWGVGRDDPRDFAYVAREKQTRQFLCHVFRLEMNARPLASALRDACKKIMIERQQKQKRPTTLPTGLRKTFAPSSSSTTACFPTPMDEPRKILRATYLGSKIVSKPTGMDTLNSAIDDVKSNGPVPVNVSVAPSVILITSDEENPKIDDEFLARYQLSYGMDIATTSKSEAPSLQAKEAADQQPVTQENQSLKRKLPPQPPAWFELDETQNTKVYVSNLPEDITEEEFVDLMQKCGLIMKDPQTNQIKIKLYSDSNGQLKGDGLCTYIKIESVQLALQILDGYDVRGKKISVERAKFQMKGTYDPTKKPKQKKRKEKEKLKKAQENLFAWKPEKLRGERAKHERVVVVQNAFSPNDFDADAGLILEYQEDFREEANKCGTCKKVVIFDRHPEGVLQIFMSTPEEADAVANLFNDRFFGGKKISSFIWDGQTKYKIAETDAEREERLQNWEKFISDGSEKSNEVAEADKATPPATPPRIN